MSQAHREHKQSNVEIVRVFCYVFLLIFIILNYDDQFLKTETKICDASRLEAVQHFHKIECIFYFHIKYENVVFFQTYSID